MPKEKRFQHNLYMFKSTVTSAVDCLSQTAVDMLAIPKRATSQEDLPHLGKGSLAVIFRGFAPAPKWAQEWKKVTAYPSDATQASPSGILIFPATGNFFALTFGLSYVYLDKRRLQHDFGLYAAVNYLVDGDLKAIEHMHIGAAMRGVRQSALNSRIGDFGVDDALDLIRKISGAPEKAKAKKGKHETKLSVENLTLDNLTEQLNLQSADGAQIATTDSHFRGRFSGATAASFGSVLDVTKAIDLAESVRKLSISKAYKNTPFEIIDKLAPERDPETIAELKREAVEEIKKGDGELEIAIPEVIGFNREVSYVILRDGGEQEPHPDINLEVYRTLLGDKLASLDVPTFESHRLDSYGVDGSPREKQNLDECLIGSISFNSKRYAANEGLWFRVDDQFKIGVDATYQNRLIANDGRFPPLKLASSTYKKTKTTAGYEPESIYNDRVCKELGLLLLDQKFIQTPAQAGPGIEICDILDWERRALIHIKKNSRQSSVLSHFFRQGATAVKLLTQDDNFRANFRKYLDELGLSDKSTAFEKDLKAWTIEFWIADTPKGTEHNIPFFSRISLQDCFAAIRAYVFDVKIGYIELEQPSTSSQ